MEEEGFVDFGVFLVLAIRSSSDGQIKRGVVGWVLGCSSCVLDNDGYNVFAPFSGDGTGKRGRICFQAMSGN